MNSLYSKFEFMVEKRGTDTGRKVNIKHLQTFKCSIPKILLS